MAVCGPILFDDHCVISHLRDGRVMAVASYTQTLGEGNHNIEIRLPDLKYIERILQVEFYSDPIAWFDKHVYMDKKVTGNIVGMTLYGLTMGVTKYTDLRTQVIAIGPP